MDSNIIYWGLFIAIMLLSATGFLSMPGHWLASAVSSFTGPFLGGLIGAVALWGGIAVLWEELVGPTIIALYLFAGILHFAIPNPLPMAESDRTVDWIMGAFPIGYSLGPIFGWWDAFMNWF